MNIAGDLVGVIEIGMKRASIMGGKYLHNFCPFLFFLVFNMSCRCGSFFNTSLKFKITCFLNLLQLKIDSK